MYIVYTIILYERYVYTYIYIYRVSDKDCANAREQVEHSKLNRKVLYYFAIFAIIITDARQRKVWSLLLARCSRDQTFRCRATLADSLLARLERTSYGLAARNARSLANLF